MKLAGVHAMRDHRAGNFEIGSRFRRDRNDRIHASNQGARPTRVLALRGGSKDQLEFLAAHPLENHPRQHLAIAARVPDAKWPSRDWSSNVSEHIHGAELGPVEGEARADGGNAQFAFLDRQQGSDRGRDAGVLPLEIRSDHFSINHASSIALHHLKSNGRSVLPESMRTMPIAERSTARIRRP